MIITKKIFLEIVTKLFVMILIGILAFWPCYFYISLGFSSRGGTIGITLLFILQIVMLLIAGVLMLGVWEYNPGCKATRHVLPKYFNGVTHAQCPTCKRYIIKTNNGWETAYFQKKE